MAYASSFEPPETLETTWLAAYAALKDGDVEELAGQVIEEACVVKRGDKWSSKFYVTDQRFLEREYRFYTECAAIAASAEQAYIRERAKQAVEEAEEEEPLSPGSPTARRNFAKADTTNTGFRTTSTMAGTWRPEKREEPGARPGVVPSRSLVEETGIDSCYQVMRPHVSIHCSPSGKASLLGVLHRHCLVRGLAFAAADGEPWLMLHEDTIEDVKLSSEVAFVPISAKSLGCADLLRRVPGKPPPGRNAWRPSAAKEPEVRRPEEGEHWKRFTQRLLAKGLRLPRCLAASWKGTPETFLLVLEKLDEPCWERVDGINEITSCTVAQAASAIDALAGFHNAFSDPRRLAGFEWLPTLPLHEQTGHMAQIFKDNLKEHRALLEDCSTPRAMAVMDKLGDYYAKLANQMSQPPLTLLHGNFHPGNLRFSTAATSAPAVAAYDWQFVCRGRGAYDFAMFLTLFASADVREECEMELMMRYLMLRGRSGREAREDFKTDVRAGILLCFAFYFLNMSTTLNSDPIPAAREAIMDDIDRFSSLIEDWDCDLSVGGIHIKKGPPKKRKYVKKSKRKTAVASKGKENPAADGGAAPDKTAARSSASKSPRKSIVGAKAKAKGSPRKSVDMAKTR